MVGDRLSKQMSKTSNVYKEILLSDLLQPYISVMCCYVTLALILILILKRVDIFGLRVKSFLSFKLILLERDSII